MKVDVVTGNINQYTPSVSDLNKMMQQIAGNAGVNTAAPKTPADIAAFMAKLGLTPTNNKELDAAAMLNRLDQLSAGAKTEADYQKIGLLFSEFSSLTKSGVRQPAPSQSLQPAKQSNNAEFTGMEQLGQMNKHFLMKKQGVQQA